MAGSVSRGTLPVPLVGRRHRVETGKGPGEYVIRRLADGEAIGCIRLAAREGGGTHIDVLAVDEGQRGYGAGSEAAHLVLDALRDMGVTEVTAWAPPELGLAVYFWYRMGLSAVPGEGPGGGLLFRLV